MSTTDIPAGLIEALRKARHVAVLTGAGVSAESGVPTFRDAQTGLWAKYSPEELATPEAFLRNPQRVWEWYEWRRGLVTEVTPNPGHRALVEIEKRVPQFTLITQNVDGLHQRAGSRGVIELHGNIARTVCSEEGTLVEDRAETDDVPSRCPNCGGLVRPDRGLVRRAATPRCHRGGGTRGPVVRSLLLHRHLCCGATGCRAALRSDPAGRCDRGDQPAVHAADRSRDLCPAWAIRSGVARAGASGLVRTGSLSQT